MFGRGTTGQASGSGARPPYARFARADHASGLDPLPLSLVVLVIVLGSSAGGGDR